MFSFKVILEARIVRLLTLVATILVNCTFSLESFLFKVILVTGIVQLLTAVATIRVMYEFSLGSFFQSNNRDKNSSASCCGCYYKRCIMFI